MEATLLRDQTLSRAEQALHAASRGGGSWHDVAQTACDFLGADEGWCVVWRRSDRQVLLMEGNGASPDKDRAYAEYFHTRDVLLDMKQPAGHWLVSDEFIPDSQATKLEFFSDWLRPNRVSQVVSLAVWVGQETFAALAFHRSTRMATRMADLREGQHGEFTRLSQAAFGGKFGTAALTQQAIRQALDSPNAVCFFADAHGCLKPVVPDAPAVSFTSALLRTDGKRFWHADPKSQARLKVLLSKATLGAVGSIHLPGDHGEAFRVDARPAPTAAKLGQGGLAFVRIERRTTNALPSEEDLSSVFDLSEHQARVLQALCAGHSVADCALLLQRSEPTIRTHIANMLHKTGCARQGDLIRMAMLVV